MIVGSCFPGDDDDALMWMQHDYYGDSLSEIFTAARRRYLDACWLVQVQSEMRDVIEKTKAFDHRILQAAHDHLAAQFRYRHRDSLQLDFGEAEKERLARLKILWQEFVREQSLEWSGDNEICRSLLEAVAFGNQERGYRAEEKLFGALIERTSDAKEVDVVTLHSAWGRAIPGFNTDSTVDRKAIED